jgi:DNA-binding NarL/FixJ family response regulator
MEQRVRVVVQAADQLSMAGLRSFLGDRQEITLLAADQRAQADVVVMAVGRLTSGVVESLRTAADVVPVPVVLVLDDVGGTDVLMIAESRAVAVIPRAAATGERVLRSVQAAAGGGGVMPPSMVTQLLDHVRRLQQELLSPGAGRLTSREADVLRLMADGMDTAEIATRLSYSERTVKKVFYSLTTRLNLRNRPHAVAYALRQGMI